MARSHAFSSKAGRGNVLITAGLGTEIWPSPCSKQWLCQAESFFAIRPSFLKHVDFRIKLSDRRSQKLESMDLEKSSLCRNWASGPLDCC